MSAIRAAVKKQRNGGRGGEGGGRKAESAVCGKSIAIALRADSALALKEGSIRPRPSLHIHHTHTHTHEQISLTFVTHLTLIINNAIHFEPRRERERERESTVQFFIRHTLQGASPGVSLLLCKYLIYFEASKNRTGIESRGG